MRRREFITLLGGAAVWPAVARGQPSANQVRRVAILFSGPESEGLPVLREALAHFGWEEGRNLRIDRRAALADLNLARTYAGELVGMKPDLIIATNAQMVKSVQDVSSTIPIVFLNVPDSVLTELVGSVSRPNRNATGFINFDSPMAGKWLELLKETVPVLSQAGVLLHAGNATAPGYLHAIEAAASALSIKLSPASASDARAIEQVMSIWAGQRNSGFVVPPSSLANTNQGLIISLAVKYRLPAIYSYPESVKAGGLMSYGFDRLDSYRKTAEYVDRVLRGAKINELPVQAPTKFELVINLKAAKAIGLDVPSILLARADEVIE